MMVLKRVVSHDPVWCSILVSFVGSLKGLDSQVAHVICLEHLLLTCASTTPSKLERTSSIFAFSGIRMNQNIYTSKLLVRYSRQTSIHTLDRGRAERKRNCSVLSNDG